MSYRYGVLGIVGVALVFSPLISEAQQQKKQTQDSKRTQQQSSQQKKPPAAPKGQAPSQPKPQMPPKGAQQGAFAAIPDQYRPPQLPPANQVVATVNGEPIFAGEVIRLSYDCFAATAVEELILLRIIEQEARKEGISVPESEIEARYKQQLQVVEAQLPPGMSMEDFMRRNQAPPSRLYGRIRALVLAEKLVARQVNLDEFVEYSQIVVRIQGNTPEQQEQNAPAAEARAREAYQKIQEGLDFTEAVKQYSDDPFTKDRGGKLNWQNLNFIPQDIREKLNALQPGQVSEPFRSAAGFVILRKERTGSMASPEEQQDLREQAVRIKLGDYVRQLQARAKITNTIVKPYNPEEAAQQESPQPRTPGARPGPR
ncbi:MAG: peptidylprolyl isomerase [Fimbriimonadales bacterium]|nr:peptidylprolyl isomerase [Fimbriimonadales bacterium]MDW8052273.1 peptidylprolyl isomerase [Armatimonadota bacterium]